MKTYYEKLKQSVLKRDEGHRYTTGNKELDNYFGLNVQFYLVPDADKIVELSCYNFLLAILGYKVTAVTSTKEGYIVSYSDLEGKHFGTFSTGMMYSEEYILKHIEQAYKKEKQKLGFKESLSINYEKHYSSSIFSEIDNPHEQTINKRDLYDAILSILSSKDSLLTRCCRISALIPDKDSIDFSSFEKVNMKNCSDNHRILCKFLCGDNSELYDVFSQYISSKESSGRVGFDESTVPLGLSNSFNAAKMLFDDLYGKIIGGYMDYFGSHKEGDHQADVYNLADSKWFEMYLPLLRQYVENTYPKADDKGKLVWQTFVDIMNMCTTDYSIDVVCSVMNKIKSITGQDTDEFLLPDAAMSTKDRAKYNLEFMSRATQEETKNKEI